MELTSKNLQNMTGIWIQGGIQMMEMKFIPRFHARFIKLLARYRDDMENSDDADNDTVTWCSTWPLRKRFIPVN